ncbi:hypothetical protein TSOC_010351 [Tetrabaena socialis]|uniref:RAP domain-containing protein n=1 Tax=Tetrabaena socialis TaxID=47790 RepID=A0A2J7ZTH2_9CHLO|nr:hypothetical protein TSOC_010351 [Tetrabaena socialis]|eukprot:PNH03577.1 hypothetical protein TSOC_010351 [Tetrabaena socialis]
MDRLAAAYLPLLPRLWEARVCVVPLWACAKAGYWGGGLPAALLQRLGQDGGALMRQATDQGHGNVWWSLSAAPQDVVTAGQTEEVLLASAESLLRLGAADIGPQECSNVLLACARLAQLRSIPTDLLHHLTACLPTRRDVNDGQHLANGLYALGELFDDCGHTPRPQDLQRLAEAVAERLACGAGVRRFIPQELSNMLLGCSKLGHDDPALLLPLASELQQQLLQQPDAFSQQALSNSLYALGVLGCVAPEYGPVVAVLAAECKRRRFAGFKPQELSNSVWALAKLGCQNDQGLFAAAVAAAVQPDVAQQLMAQGWCNLWYGLALVGHWPDAAFLERTVAASGLLRTCAKGQECVNLLWSLATLGVPYNPPLVGALAERLGELLPQKGVLSAQALVSTLWAMVVMGRGVLSRHHSFTEGLLREVVRRWDQGEAAVASGGSVADPFMPAGLAQLWQVQQELAHEDGCSDLVGILAATDAGSPSSLPNAIKHVAADRRREADPVSSGLQRRVVNALERLQRRLAHEQQSTGIKPIVSVKVEQSVEGLAGRVDAVVELEGGEQVALEVDGPVHFMSNEPFMHALNGSTQLRNRQLERVFGEGNVLSVPYWEWDEAREGREWRDEEYALREAREEEYLLRLLGLAECGL